MDDELNVYGSDFRPAWEEFAKEMERAFHPKAGDPENRPLATQQVRYVLASMAIADLLDRVGSHGLAEHFHFLAAAMNDLVEGIPHPLFRTEIPSGRGRHADTSAVWDIRSSVCVSIELLLAGGMDEESAIQLIVSKHGKAFQKLLRSKADLKSSIKNWMKSFANDEVRNELALSTYKAGMDLFSTLKSKHSGDLFRQVGEAMAAKAAERASALVSA